MAWRNRVPPDLRRMTVRTLEHRSLRGNTRLTLCDLRTDVARMTRAATARQDRNIGILHTLEVGRLGYADMADRTVVIRVVFGLVVEF